MFWSILCAAANFRTYFSLSRGFCRFPLLCHTYSETLCKNEWKKQRQISNKTSGETVRQRERESEWAREMQLSQCHLSQNQITLLTQYWIFIRYEMTCSYLHLYVHAEIVVSWMCSSSLITITWLYPTCTSRSSNGVLSFRIVYNGVVSCFWSKNAENISFEKKLRKWERDFYLKL